MPRICRAVGSSQVRPPGHNTLGTTGAFAGAEMQHDELLSLDGHLQSAGCRDPRIEDREEVILDASPRQGGSGWPVVEISTGRAGATGTRPDQTRLRPEALTELLTAAGRCSRRKLHLGRGEAFVPLASSRR